MVQMTISLLSYLIHIICTRLKNQISYFLFCKSHTNYKTSINENFNKKKKIINAHFSIYGNTI